MKVSRSALLPLQLAGALWLAGSAHGADPVLDQPVVIRPADDASETTIIPIGKTLIVPLTATDADGDRLTYKVKASHNNVRVRVRTGNPKLKIQVDHASGGEDDPAFSGVMEFALFRDLTPITASFIGGFAQSGYYNEQVFHRIADLNPLEDADGSFIIQGGDPDGSDPTKAGTGGPGFAFDNEFHPGLIFSGRGQLAMANSGINSTTYKGTNGSQFFITEGHPRFLDFNHTIFGQLLRGWDVLEQVADVPRFPNVPDREPEEVPDRPKVDVTLTAVTLEPNFQDAILIISAVAPGEATITVEVTDESGGKDSKSFTVRPIMDDTNDPPFIQPVDPKTAPLGKIFQIPLKIIDLERDYFTTSNRALTGSIGQAGGSNPALTLSNAIGPVLVGTSVTQFDMKFRNESLDPVRGTDDQIVINVAGGDKAITAKAGNIKGAPATPLMNITVASFTDTDGSAQPSEYTAKVNWGDGSVPTTGTIVRDPSSPLPTAFIVRDSHQYAQAGTYPLVVTLTSEKGQSAVLRGTAFINNGTLHPIGRTLTTKGARLANGVVATFTDETPAALTAYTATISWGDGTHGAGTIRRGPTGEFQVLGTHVFPDPQDYLVVVRIHKAGTDLADAPYAWSRVEARGFVKAEHMPPFKAANLVGQFGQFGNTPLRSTSGNSTLASGQLIVLNSGNRRAKGVKIRFFLSKDTVLDEEEDVPVLIGSARAPSINLGNLPPGAARSLVFAYTAGQPALKVPPGGEYFGLPAPTRATTSDTRLRFPPGETGAGLNLLVHLSYNDTLTRYMPVDREIVLGPFDAFVVGPTTLDVREAGGVAESATFKVRLTREPTGDVTIPITLPAVTETQPAQITVDKTSLVFTPENWNVDQEVLVTAIDDETADGLKVVRVTLGRAESTDPVYHNADPPDITVIVRDKVPTN